MPKMSKNGLFAHVKAQEERKLVDKLRDIGLGQYIELPQIAVMGDTSSGKSSLLSALSGVSFPSNDQLTTRCPTQLILTRADTFRGTVRLVRFQSSSENDEGEEKQELNRLEDVPDAITKLTQKLVDEGQNISDDQIVIEMCGPELPNLTLTDLPGLVRTVGDREDQSIIPRRQQFGKWADQYLRLVEAAMDGRYELLPTSSSRSLQQDGVVGKINARLRAVLRVEEASFQEAINETKDRITEAGSEKTQEEVAVGDFVQIEIDGVWQSGRVKEIKGTDIWCEGFIQWKSKCYWRYDERAILKQFIRENRGDELAIFTSYQVFCNLFRQCVDKWGPPTNKLLSSYQSQTKLVSDFVSDEIHASSRVVQFIRSTAADVLDRVVAAASQEIETLLTAEDRPYTQDERLFQDLDQQRLQALQEQVKAGVPVDSDGKVLLTEVMKTLQAATLSTEDREVLEMQVALHAYLDVAVPRFVDAIPMRLNDLVLRKFVVEMTNELNGLTDDKLARLMQDPEHKIAERQQLKEELACLASARKEIELVC
ncbi:hypothetical protein PPTG_06303 [Phytophthora nicotianae INRA-310]|uniref:GED domain-containing protein n=1 Tax=Phytophthora nicotianae (strain INRA-310) TaxID=761204 RepID=W2QUX3_PHYN3|nr:hypothetical protein PPTG_06303 [Phytophthora nicotianae INRA-310]ETN16075.1 hypothetical protein PPTG_06303 [Phytophthora nicotianae INRA-310]